MFWEKDKDKESLLIEIEALRKEKRAAKEEVEELKFKKRLEQEEIVHLQKINEAKLKQELDTEKTRILKEKNDEMLNFKKQQMDKLAEIGYAQSQEIVKMNIDLHEKMEKRFNTELGNLKEIYQELMKRLPTINMAITKKM